MEKKIKIVELTEEQYDFVSALIENATQSDLIVGPEEEYDREYALLVYGAALKFGVDGSDHYYDILNNKTEKEVK